MGRRRGMMRVAAVMIAVITVMGLSGVAGGAPGPPIGRDGAIQILIDEVIDPPTLRHDLIAFTLAEPLQAGDVISPASPQAEAPDSGGVEPPYAKAYLIDRPTWFFWINDFPYAMFAHDTRYVFIDDETGEWEVFEEDWWPLLNGGVIWGPEEYWNKDNWAYSTYLGDPPGGGITGGGETNPSGGTDGGEDAGQCPHKKRELIIEGCDHQGLQKYMRKDCEEWYRLFKEKFGYTDKELIYLAAEYYTSPPGEWHPPISGIATEERVKKEIEKFYPGGSDELKGCDSLSIYFSGHGGQWEWKQAADGTWWAQSVKPTRECHQQAYISVCGNMLRDEELKEWLCQIADCVHIKVVLDACYSGGFIDDLCQKKNIDVVITATDHDSVSFVDVERADFAKLKEKPGVIEDPNPDDEGSEFTSGLIEDLRALAKDFAAGKITQTELYRRGFETAREKDFGWRNHEVLKKNYGDKKAPNPQRKLAVFVGGTVVEEGAIAILMPWVAAVVIAVSGGTFMVWKRKRGAGRHKVK